ncbi:MAG TPA: PIG-L family deacetylase [Opitutaceae bacterium]|nr:PIG-L family deacetylase [Opitutaceae bacterium]
MAWAAFAADVAAQRPRFDPGQDYGYDLAATQAEVTAVELDGQGFAWPAGADAADTIWLELGLSASEGPAPELAADRGGAGVRQVFEERAKGRRFLDVSPLRHGAGGRVVLAGRGVAWRPGPARLFLYRNRPLAGRRVLVLAPHPDDAEIAAFGVYRHAGADVVTVTAGDSGWENFKALYPETGEHYRIKGMLRTWNSITAPFYGGVMPGQARNLGYYNGRLAEMRLEPAKEFPPLRAMLEHPAYYRRMNVDAALRDRPFRPAWVSLVDDLLWELRRVRPEVIVTPHPLLDSHVEHQLTTIALGEALARWEGEVELYLYTNHGMTNEAYPLGDRHAMTGLPAWPGGELYFSRLCSHPLTPEDRRLKLVALEAQHDLRAFDLRDGQDPLPEAKKLSLQRNDYYRRAPRPVELFFVASRADVARLCDAWLRHQAPR